MPPCFVFLCLLFLACLFISCHPARRLDGIIFMDDSDWRVRISHSREKVHSRNMEPHGSRREENQSDYPEKEINKYLDQNPQFAALFTAKRTKIENRGSADDYKRACDFTTEWIHPRYLEDVTGEMRVLINTNKYKQFLLVERCKNNGHTHREDTSECVLRLRGKCVQESRDYMLGIYLEAEKNVTFKQFKVNSCCVCLAETF